MHPTFIFLPFLSLHPILCSSIPLPPIFFTLPSVTFLSLKFYLHGADMILSGVPPIVSRPWLWVSVPGEQHNAASPIWGSPVRSEDSWSWSATNAHAQRPITAGQVQYIWHHCAGICRCISDPVAACKSVPNMPVFTLLLWVCISVLCIKIYCYIAFRVAPVWFILLFTGKGRCRRTIAWITLCFNVFLSFPDRASH